MIINILNIFKIKLKTQINVSNLVIFNKNLKNKIKI